MVFHQDTYTGMKKVLMLMCALAACAFASAQQSDVKLKLYGSVRADLFYNTRANVETVDGLFYLFPKNHAYDADGKDLNGDAQGSLYMLYTRLGLDVAGPTLMGARSSAKIEADFRGSGSGFGTVRLRQAYVNLDWGRSALLVGQTWHPLSGDALPQVLNLATGAPFNPFNRSPLIRYRYKAPTGVQLTLAAIWQSQYNSVGPNGASADYLKNGCLPEGYAGIDYIRNRFSIGAGIDLLSLRPRKQSEVDGKVYKVSERVNSLSAEAHVRYSAPMYEFMAKTIYGSNLTHCQMLGGFAATSIDSRTGEMKYTPTRQSTSWVNFTYGRKWKPGIFVGYMKNLGTGKEIVGPAYGTGLDVDQVVNVSAQISYNLPHWRLGLEFTPCTAWYGTLDKHNGKVTDAKAVTNYRFLLAMVYSF